MIAQLEKEGDWEGTRENVGDCGCEIETATAPTTERSSESLPLVVGPVVEDETVAIAQSLLSTEIRSLTLLSVVGAVDAVGGVKSWAVVLVKKLMRDWVQPEGLGLFLERQWESEEKV